MSHDNTERTESDMYKAALALLFVQEDGSPMIQKAAATQLLAQIDSMPMGLGSSSLLVPVDAIKTAGLRAGLWEEEGFSILSHKGQPCYSIPEPMAHFLQDSLELQAGQGVDLYTAKDAWNKIQADSFVDTQDGIKNWQNFLEEQSQNTERTR